MRSCADEGRQAIRAVTLSALGLAVTGLIVLAPAIVSGPVGLLGEALQHLSDVSPSPGEHRIHCTTEF
jgi:hypothetical protein